MSKKKIIQIIAITLLVFAIIIFIQITKWTESDSVWGFVILVLGTLSSIISIFIPTNYTLKFDKLGWQKNNNEFYLNIPFKKHGLGNSPQIQTFMKIDSSYEEVEVDSHHDEKGNITIIVNSPFDGKIIIK